MTTLPMFRGTITDARNFSSDGLAVDKGGFIKQIAQWHDRQLPNVAHSVCQLSKKCR